MFRYVFKNNGILSSTTAILSIVICFLKKGSKEFDSALMTLEKWEEGALLCHCILRGN